VVRGHPSLSTMSPFDRAHTTSYSSLIETIRYRKSLSLNPFPVTDLRPDVAYVESTHAQTLLSCLIHTAYALRHMFSDSECD